MPHPLFETRFHHAEARQGVVRQRTTSIFVVFLSANRATDADEDTSHRRGNVIGDSAMHPRLALSPSLLVQHTFFADNGAVGSC